ncbi:histidine kinase [Fodinibacter luteus]|uniref:histidine kinase n=1 Tax=Fodinibacter luteus TaxID=552064 RepID=A0ABP8KFW3_9MICO
MKAQPGWVEASRRLSPYLDPAIGIVAAVFALASLLSTDPGTIDPRLAEPNILSAVATLAAAGALAWRRRRPVASYAVMVAGALVVSLTDHYIGLLSVLSLFSLYSLAAHGQRRDALVGLGAGVACFGGLALLDVPDLGLSDLLQALALLTAAWAIGDAIRSRRQQQRDQLNAAVAEERLRIARDLHDVVAHSMSLIAVQAGVGAHVIRSDVPAAQRSLEIIADTARKALVQTRSMLGMLREETQDSARPPTHGLADLPALVDDVRAAGLDIELSRAPLPGLDAAVSLTAYRVIQESLTNVIKHSAASTAMVTVAAIDHMIDLEVIDPGPARTPSGTPSGHGLVGLAERVRLVGGAVEYGTHDAGFRVHATLPAGGTR